MHGSHVGLDSDRFCWTLVNDGPDAVIYADYGGLIRFWNRGAERIFGYSAAEASGRSLDIIIQHASPGAHHERNWLPAPDGSFNLALRLYWPKAEVLDKTWKPSGVSKVE